MIPTTRVTCDLFDLIGAPAVGADVRISLTRTDRDPDHGVIHRSEIRPVVDSDGRFEVDLWPNERGTDQSQYRVIIPSADPNRPDIWDVLITVPSAGPVQLRSIVSMPPFPPIDAAQQAVQTAQAAAIAAQAAADTIPDPTGEVAGLVIVTSGDDGYKLAEAAGGGAALSDDDPESLGTADPGESLLASRADHVHPIPGAADVGADPAGSAASAQAHAVQRANHTGTQAISTVTGLQSALDNKLEAETDPTVPAHVKDIPAPVTDDHVLTVDGGAWVSKAPPAGGGGFTPDPTGQPAGKVAQTTGSNSFALEPLNAGAVSAYNGTDQIKIWDNFRRTGASLGTSDSGHAWVNLVGNGFQTNERGTAWRAAGGTAGVPTISAIERTDFGSEQSDAIRGRGDVLVFGRMAARTQDMSIILARDVDNLYEARIRAGANIELYKTVAGTSTLIASASTNLFALRGSDFRIELICATERTSSSSILLVRAPDLDAITSVVNEPSFYTIFPEISDMRYAGIRSTDVNSGAYLTAFGVRNLSI